MIAHFDKIVFNSNRVLNAAKIMEMPVMATEQYPKGLGKTVPEIELAKFEIVPFEKTCFTMAIPEVGGWVRYHTPPRSSHESPFKNAMYVTCIWKRLPLCCSSCPSWRRSRAGPQNL